MLSRFNLILIVSVLVVVCPKTGHAQQEAPRPGLRLPTTMFAVAATADWASTYHGVKHYRLRETNPVLRRYDRTPAKMVLIGAAIDAGSVVAWNHFVGRKHPRVAAAGLWTMTAFRAYLALHNIRNVQRATRR